MTMIEVDLSLYESKDDLDNAIESLCSSSFDQWYIYGPDTNSLFCHCLYTLAKSRSEKVELITIDSDIEIDTIKAKYIADLVKQEEKGVLEHVNIKIKFVPISIKGFELLSTLQRPGLFSDTCPIVQFWNCELITEQQQQQQQQQNMKFGYSQSAIARFDLTIRTTSKDIIMNLEDAKLIQHQVDQITPIIDVSGKGGFSIGTSKLSLDALIFLLERYYDTIQFEYCILYDDDDSQCNDMPFSLVENLFHVSTLHQHACILKNSIVVDKRTSEKLARALSAMNIQYLKFQGCRLDLEILQGLLTATIPNHTQKIDVVTFNRCTCSSSSSSSKLNTNNNNNDNDTTIIINLEWSPQRGGLLLNDSFSPTIATVMKLVVTDFFPGTIVELNIRKIELDRDCLHAITNQLNFSKLQKLMLGVVQDDNLTQLCETLKDNSTLIELHIIRYDVNETTTTTTTTTGLSTLLSIVQNNQNTLNMSFTKFKVQVFNKEDTKCTELMEQIQYYLSLNEAGCRKYLQIMKTTRSNMPNLLFPRLVAKMAQTSNDNNLDAVYWSLEQFPQLLLKLGAGQKRKT